MANTPRFMVVMPLMSTAESWVDSNPAWNCDAVIAMPGLCVARNAA